MLRETPPSITVNPATPAQPASRIALTGAWLVLPLSAGKLIRKLTAQLNDLARRTDVEWDLTQLHALDNTGAQLLWEAWGKKRPEHLLLTPTQESFFVRLDDICRTAIPQPQKQRLTHVMQLGAKMLDFANHLADFIVLTGQLVIDIGQFARHPLRGPWREISANIYRAGFQALGITALVGSLIGVVLSFLSAQQLSTFGGDLFLVNILGMSIVRELGPLLAAILVAGRSGSAITAQLGVMRVTEELDAMQVMGIPHGFRLVMPKVVALAIAMPLLVIWTDVMALLGGMMSAFMRLGMSPRFFLYKLSDAVPLVNYWIGFGKGCVFGILIALVACHFGLRIKANTQSLGQGTTSSVVIAITVVIIVDAIFAIVFSKAGF